MHTSTYPSRFLQLFADPNQQGTQQTANSPTGGGNQPGGEQGGAQQPKTYTEEQLQAEVRKARDAAAAAARRELEGKYKPQLEEAQKALDAAKPFLENPTQYMTQFLAANPVALQAVAQGVEVMLKGGVPTAAQIRTIGQAADNAGDPKVAKKLEQLEAEMKAVRESAEEQKTLQSELKAFAKEASEAGLEWDEDGFREFVDKYADENEIGDDDPIDTRLLFRLWKAEQKLSAGSGRKLPKLPGGAPPPSTPRTQAKNWDEATAQAEEYLRRAQRE